MKKFENKIWLSSPTLHGDELEYITQAYNSNWMSTMGENINVIEQEISEITGCKYAVALSCGTSALHLAIKLTGLKPGEKVFCSDLTFAATVNPIVYEHGVPVFIDSEQETWNINPTALSNAFKKHPEVRIVVVANLYGVPAKFDEIKAVCKEHNAILIEDAAESFGATYKSQPTGSFGTYNVISFNGNKIITGSSGGMLLTNDLSAAQKARKWSAQSREKAPWYQHEEIGYNYRMSNVIAGVVRGQLPYLQEHITQKKAIYMRYKEGLKDLPITMNPYIESIMEPNFWLSCMLIDESAICEHHRNAENATYKKAPGKTCPTEILEKLEECNAEGRPLWKPMHMQPLFKDCDFVTADDCIVSEDLFNRGLCLPSDNKMTQEEQDRIIEIIRSCF